MHIRPSSGVALKDYTHLIETVNTADWVQASNLLFHHTLNGSSPETADVYSLP
jgi:hypothetical protein